MPKFQTQVRRVSATSWGVRIVLAGSGGKNGALHQRLLNLGMLLDTRGDAGYFRSFYARRVLRILPLYYLL